MVVKWNNKIILIDKSYTSKTCCNLTIDRDINALINIYNSKSICK